eukprot:gene8771-9673_t
MENNAIQNDVFQAWIKQQYSKVVRSKNGGKASQPQAVIGMTENKPPPPLRCSIFNLPLPLFFPVMETTCHDDTGVRFSKEEEGEVSQVVGVSDGSRGMTCRTCQLIFSSRDEQSLHFKTRFHHFNLMRKLKGDDVLTIEQYEAMDKKEREENDDAKDSSDSGEEGPDSESELSDTQEQQEMEGNDDTSTSEQVRLVRDPLMGSISKLYLPKLGPQFLFQPNHLNGYVMSCSSAVFSQDSSLADSRRWWMDSSAGDLWKSASQRFNTLQQQPIIAVIILRSGRFAGAIFEGDNVVTHKVLRRYTVRAKAGGGQSSYDNKGMKARSMGAQLRRYGEKALTEDVQAILTKWNATLKSASLILIATTKTMRPILFEDTTGPSSDTTLLKKNDARIVNVPFAVDKPTLESAKTVHSIVTSVRLSVATSEVKSVDLIEEDEEIVVDIVGELDERDDKLVKSSKKGVEDKEKEDGSLSYQLSPAAQRIISACEALSDEEIVKIIEEEASLYSQDIHNLSWSDVISSPQNLEDLLTALHIAARRGLQETVDVLLQQGANPEREDVRGRTPYVLCASKAERAVFRKARASLGEDAWNWTKAGVDEALSEDKLKAQKAKEKEKKKRAAQRKKEQKVRDEEALEDALQLKLAEEVARELDQREEEERMRNLAGYCVTCGESLYRKNFFDVLDFRCCSTACVAKLRRQLAADAALQRLNK